MYVNDAEQYMGVTGKNKVALVGDKPPKGKWLFGDEQLVFWVSDENEWQINEENVLTRNDDGTVTLKQLFTKTKSKYDTDYTRQQWMYDDDSEMLLTVEAANLEWAEGMKKSLTPDQWEV